MEVRELINMLFTSALIVSALNFGQGFATIMKREEASSNVSGTFYKLGLTAFGAIPLDSDMVAA